MKHPAKYTDTFIPIFSEILSNCNVVLDPFAGTGKLALIKAHGFKGRVICNEIEPEWTKSADYDVDEWRVGDAANMDWAEDNSIDAICTSPTYGNRMADHFNAKDGSKRITYRHFLGRPLEENNTGRMQWGKEYRKKHVEVYKECIRVLKNNGKMVVNISDHIRAGEQIPVVDWHKNTLIKLGMKIVDEIKIDTPRMGFGANAKARVQHEFILVFKIRKCKIKVKVMRGDCLKRMKEIPDGSVDAIICDPPYGTTACTWDSIIPLKRMWRQLKRVIKPNGAIVMTASQPFTTKMIASNMEMFKYCWVWEKSRATGHVHAKNKPMKKHEDILVFSPGTTVHANQSASRMTYNPQGLTRKTKPTIRKAGGTSDAVMKSRPSHKDTIQEFEGYPNSVLYVASEGKTIHPTQKPIALMEYLIKTYTNEGETVLDFTMGSGTTGVACVNTNRNFIGIELDRDYFIKAKRRIREASNQTYKHKHDNIKRTLWT